MDHPGSDGYVLEYAGAYGGDSGREADCCSKGSKWAFQGFQGNKGVEVSSTSTEVRRPEDTGSSKSWSMISFRELTPFSCRTAGDDCE